jgi:hypothetical protein
VESNSKWFVIRKVALNTFTQLRQQRVGDRNLFFVHLNNNPTFRTWWCVVDFVGVGDGKKMTPGLYIYSRLVPSPGTQFIEECQWSVIC